VGGRYDETAGRAHKYGDRGDGCPKDSFDGTYPSIGKRTHVGVDLVAACGTPVYAFKDGHVIDLVESKEDQNFDSLGYMVLIQHGDSETIKTESNQIKRKTR
jgi:murein DD-endopeptidase MepM/ murein hydrolase activator NlpD